MYIVPTSARTCPSIASLRRTKTQILNANKTFGIIGPCINHKYTCILYGKWIYGNTAPFIKAKILNETFSVLVPYKIQIDAENIILSAITPFNKQINRIQLLKKGLEVYEHANYAICWYDWMLPVRKFSGGRPILQRHWLYNITFCFATVTFCNLFALKRQNILIVILILWYTHTRVC